MDTATVSLTLQNGAEDFTVPDSLQSSTVLYFMRASSCAQCNRHTRDLEKLKPELEKRGLSTIVIVPEGTEAANKVKERNHLTMPVMAGNGTAHALAGLDKKFLGLIQVSGTIVVDTTGKVLYKKIATNPENSFNGHEFEEYLASVEVR
jgi:peroxiredoxin